MGVTTLADVREGADRSLYPTHVLDGCETGLVVFAAAFNGLQDAVWFEEAGIQTWCLDNDRERLDRMQPLYPDDWTFILADAYEWIRATGGRWDVVSVDCPTGHFARCAELAPRFCELARRAVVLGSAPAPRVKAPDGWKVTHRTRRSAYAGGVYWTTLEPA